MRPCMLQWGWAPRAGDDAGWGPQQLLSKHPNIVQYHDAAVRDARNGGQTVLILMELCPGPCAVRACV
jgi:hypothetical protein